jgi:hypothetical protein
VGDPKTAEEALIKLINLTKGGEYEQVKAVWVKWQNEIDNSSYKFVMNQLEEYLKINKKVKLNQ